MALGKRIRMLRQARGWSQETLSEKTGGVVSQGAISNLEKRDSTSSSFTKVLADALGVDVELLLLDETDPASPFRSEEQLDDVLSGFPIGTSEAGALTKEEDRAVFVIPEYATGGAMGGGLLLPDQPGVIHGWRVNEEWIEKNARNYTSKRNLAIVTGFGDSMRPLFNPGDPLLVDTGVKEVKYDAVYFFRIGDEGFIKRLQRVPTEQGMIIRALSQNDEYQPFDITPKMDFEVLARVIRVWCGTDF